jgi:hypothetical protein
MSLGLMHIAAIEAEKVQQEPWNVGYRSSSEIVVDPASWQWVLQNDRNPQKNNWIYRKMTCKNEMNDNIKYSDLK